MKIGIIATVAGPGPVAGGVWRVAETHAAALAHVGHEVRVLAGWLGPPPADPPLAQSMHLMHTYKPLPGHDIRFLIATHLGTGVRALTDWADVLHVHLCRDYVSTRSVRIAKKLGHRRIVAQAHGMLDAPGSRITKVFDAVMAWKVYEFPDLWLSLGPEEDAKLRRLGIDMSRVHRTHNAVARPTRTWANPPGTPHFVFASRLHARKQPLVFVEAALAYLRAGHSGLFTIAGPDQGELAKIEALLSGNDRRGSFRLLGAISTQQVNDELLQATAMVLPSLDEPYPMIVLEAAALGVPIIVSDQTGVSDLLRTRDAAEVITPSAERLTASLVALSQDSSRLTALSGAALSAYRELWTEERLGSALSEAYQGSPKSIDLTAAETAPLDSDDRRKPAS